MKKTLFVMTALIIAPVSSIILAQNDIINDYGTSNSYSAASPSTSATNANSHNNSTNSSNAGTGSTEGTSGTSTGTAGDTNRR